jgi:hypothetical protein
MICPFRAKIKFYLFGIAARPTEKLAAQIILFAFQTIFFISPKRTNHVNIHIHLILIKK